jgi:hypothetical protein
MRRLKTLCGKVLAKDSMAGKALRRCALVTYQNPRDGSVTLGHAVAVLRI